MPIIVNCRKCNKPITITDEMLDEARRHGSALDVVHDVCPDEQDALHAYRFVIKVDKDGEKVASVGETVEAISFLAAQDALTKSINKQWERVVQMANVIDAPLPDDQDSSSAS
jgi:hypothetical protein